MRIVFIMIWAALLLVPQMLFKFHFFNIPLGIGFIALLVIYEGLSQTFFKGLFSVALITFMAEMFSLAPHGILVLPNLILFVGMQLLIDRLYTEAYLTKAFWAFIFSLAGSFLTAVAFTPEGSPILYSMAGGLMQSAINAVVAFPLFILLDKTCEPWVRFFSSRKAHLTGADLYQAQSSQRKYF